MKDYYRILRVSRSASAGEIKRSYRLLVQQLHPDVNPDPSAHELVKEVNEAYEVLGDTSKRGAYDYRLNNPEFTIDIPQEPVHRDPAYRRRGAARHAAPQGPTQQDLMQKYLHVAAKIEWVGCALCLLLIIDFNIPHRMTTDTVQTFQGSTNVRSRTYYLVTHNGRQIKLSDHDVRFFELDQAIEIIESGMFSILVEVRIPALQKSVTNLSTVYRNFVFAPLMLFAFSVLGAIGKGGVEFRFNLGIVNLFVLIFTIILLVR